MFSTSLAKIKLLSLLPLGVLLSSTSVISAADLTTWPSQYTMRPWETSRLTGADVVGPDGIVYPDFTGVGVTGGIPDINNSTVRATYTVFNVKTGYGAVGNGTTNDDTSVANATSAALAHVAANANNKAILYFPAGTYRLSLPLIINRNNVVIDGDGPTSTILRLHTNSAATSSPLPGLITFRKPANYSGYLLATAPILRGSSTATFNLNPATQGYAVGTWTRLILTVASGSAASATTLSQRFSNPDNHIVYNDINKHIGRPFFAKVVAINTSTNTITFDRTFTHDYFLDEIPQLRRPHFVENCGVQDLAIETVDASATIDPITFGASQQHHGAADSWLKNIIINKARDYPIVIWDAARVEIRDCQFLGTWTNINSGARAYLGWTGDNTDCLMDNVQGSDLRHMAIFQKANRSVIRNSTFTGRSVTSPQLHGGYPHDNLIETTTFNTVKADDITSTRGLSAYASDGGATLRHGVEGPRNVFYNNQVLSGSGSVSLAGLKEGLIFAYNRILKTNDAEQLPSFQAANRSFDAVVRGNIFQSIGPRPFLSLEDPTCTGWHVTDNLIYGSNGYLYEGDSAPALAHNNRFFSTGTTPAAATTPEVPSIYDWQKTHANTARLVLVIDRRTVSDTGGTTTGTVVRVKSSTASALTVNLQTDLAGLSIPTSVTIPAGSTHADFTLTGTAVSGGEKLVTVTATASGLMADTEKVFVLDDQNVTQPNFGADKWPVYPAGLPANWRAGNYGLSYGAGTQTYTSATATWQITGSGIAAGFNSPPESNLRSYDSTLAKNGRRFVYQTMDGDGEIRARITAASGDSQVGLMIADDESTITDFVMLEATGRVMSSSNRNDVPRCNAYVQALGGTKVVPQWLRLKRTGFVFTAYKSTVTNPTSESDWTQIVSFDMYRAPVSPEATDYFSPAILDQRMHWGLFINSGSSTTLASATFTGVALTGTVVPTDGGVTVPDAPSALAATATSASQINLTWMDNADEETGFLLERSPDGANGWTQIAAPAANAVSYSDTGLTSSTAYYYRVRATNSAGNSAYTSVASATTDFAPPPSPLVRWRFDGSISAEPTSYNGTASGSVSYVTGQIGTQALSLDGTNHVATPFVLNPTSNFTVAAWVRLAATSGNTQTILQQQDGAGTGRGWLYRNPTTGSFSSFLGNVETATTGTIPLATWTHVALVNTSGTLQLYLNGIADGSAARNIESCVGAMRIGAHKSLTNANWNGLIDDLRIYNSALVAAQIAAVYTENEPIAPASPTGLAATAASATQVNLTWIDSATNETGYRVEFSPNGTGNWATLTNLPANSTAHSDTGLTPGTTYYYRVFATNAVGDSTASNTADASTPLLGQTITFAPLAPKTYGTGTFTLDGSASSGLTVTYTSSDTGVATVEGNLVTLVSAGTTTITATQAGNSSYSAATPIPQDLTVNQATQNILFSALPSKTVFDSDFTLSGSATSGLTVTYASSNPEVASVSGNLVSIHAVGDTTITASQTGNANFTAATEVPQTLTVTRASQFITFDPLPPKAPGDPAFTLAATASSGLAVSYESDNPAVATVSGNLVTIIGAGTTNITASQSGDANHAAAEDVTQLLDVTSGGLIVHEPFNYAVPLNAPDPDGTVNSGNGLPATNAGGTPSGTSTGLYGSWGATLDTTTGLSYSQGSHALTSSGGAGAPNNATWGGDPRFYRLMSVDPFLSRRLGGVNNGNFGVNGQTLFLSVLARTSTATGSAWRLNLAGSARNVFLENTATGWSLNENAAGPVPTTGTLTLNTTTLLLVRIDFVAGAGDVFRLWVNPPLDQPLGAANATLTTAVDYGGLASFNPRPASPGTMIFDELRVGTSFAAVAPFITVVPQTISFGPLAARQAGDSDFNLSATSTSGLPIRYTSSNLDVATVTGNVVSIVGLGTTTVTAYQDGDATYSAAPPVPQDLVVSAVATNLTGTAAALTGANLGSGSAGSATVLSSGAWWIDGSGLGLTGTSDSFHFESKAVTGDAQIIVRIENLVSTGGVPRAGLMFRESTASNARYVMVAVPASSSGNFRYGSRTSTGAVATETTATGGGSTHTLPNTWLMLQRSGDTIFIATSATAEGPFLQIGSVTLANLAGTLQAGVFSSSGTTGVNARAVMSDYDFIPMDVLGGVASRWRFNNSLAAEPATYNGTAVGSIGYATGRTGSHALSLNGNNSNYVSTPFALNPASGSFTAAAWVKLAASSNSNLIILQQLDLSGTGRSWLFRKGNGQLATFLGNIETTTAATLPADGNWHHLAVVKNGSTGTNVQIYVNGTASGSPTARTVESCAGTLRIGAHKSPNGSNRNWNGQIDDVRIYNRALLPSEILTIANRTE